jgi:hypothetical protein
MHEVMLALDKIHPQTLPLQVFSHPHDFFNFPSYCTTTMSSKSRETHPLLYEPLPQSAHEIRLLTLQPSSNPEEMATYSVTRKSLDSDLHFEALSYAWGKPGDEATIIVNGIPMAVKRNGMSPGRDIWLSTSLPRRKRVRGFGYWLC